MIGMVTVVIPELVFMFALPLVAMRIFASSASSVAEMLIPFVVVWVIGLAIVTIFCGPGFGWWRC